MQNLLLSKLSLLEDKKIVFLDLTDSLFTKTLSEKQLFRLWSKLMVRELGINLKIDELYLIRKECESFIAEKLGKKKVEVPYQEVIDEVYTRLLCTKSLFNTDKTVFTTCFRNSDHHAVILLQQPNAPLFEALYTLKEKGYRLFAFADFFGSSSLLQDYLNHHRQETIFERVATSSDYGKSTVEGELYQSIIAELELNADEVVILTSKDKINYKSPIKTLHIPQTNVNESDFENSSDQKRYRKIVRALYTKCNNKTAPPHSDYILFYYVYIERLYKKAKQDGIKNICFLAREGLFLKKLFDHYQAEMSINKETDINAHYFKASRNSLMLASFKDLKIEKFEYLRRRWPDLSVNSFLKNFNFAAETADNIVQSAGLENVRDVVTKSFLDSELFKKLRENIEFVKAYDETRNSQKKYFIAYLDSFDIDIKSEGIHISDVGWGGTMQNRLYDFFEHEVQVHGYYLGVREINNIRTDTIKHGLNFSVYPFITFSDHILMANVELNEQLLAAGHGSTIAYTDKESGYTIEHHEENDKRVYDAYIGETQDFMFERFKELTQQFKIVCYDEDLEQSEMVDHALRIGLFASKRKVAREVNIYKGFYQNVGNFSVGLAMGENFGRKEKMELLKNFFRYPEEAFRYVLRLKPMLMRSKKYFLAYFIPSYPIYWFIKARSKRKGLN